MKLAYEIVRERIQASKETQEYYYNRNTAPVIIDVGDIVYLHTPVVQLHKSKKLTSPYKGPYRVIEQTGDLNFRTRHLDSGKCSIVHVNRLKRYATFAEDEQDKQETNANTNTPIQKEERVELANKETEVTIPKEVFYDCWEDLSFMIANQNRPAMQANSTPDVTEPTPPIENTDITVVTDVLSADSNNPSTLPPFTTSTITTRVITDPHETIHVPDNSEPSTSTDSAGLKLSGGKLIATRQNPTSNYRLRNRSEVYYGPRKQ